MFRCPWMIETAHLVNCQEEIGLKKTPTVLHQAQAVMIKTSFKDLLTQENVSALFQAVTLQLT